jgi:hypothetical protein
MYDRPALGDAISDAGGTVGAEPKDGAPKESGADRARAVVEIAAIRVQEPADNAALRRDNHREVFP